MSKIELPPEPKAAGKIEMRHAVHCAVHDPSPGRCDCGAWKDAVTLDQLRARDRQIVELCAQICLDRSIDGPEAMTAEAMLCAAAIRNLIEESNNG